MRQRYRAALLLFAALAGGCGREPEYAVVEGTVTRNGRPAAKIEVTFYADEGTSGPLASGLTDANGRYRLQTEAGRDGAVVGNHRVCLYDRDPALLLARHMGSLAAAEKHKHKLPPEVAGKLSAPIKLPAPAKTASSRVPDPYMQPWETPLRAEVRPGTQTHDFQLP